MPTAAQRAQKGLNAATRALNDEIASVRGRTSGGMLALGNVILRRSNKRVPREYGNLINSGYARKAQNNPLSVEIGYSANYAVYVHENLEMKLKGKPRPSGLGVYWGPSGEAKFLEKALNETKSDAAGIVASYVRR